MKHFFLFLSIAVLLTACGTYTPGNTNYNNSSAFANQRSSANLPANPDPNKCYVRCVTPDEYEVYEKEYLTYTEEEARDFPHRLTQLTIIPEMSQWESTTYEGCKSDDPDDCQVLCFKTYPAVKETIYSPIDTTLGNPFWKIVEFEELIEKGGLTSYEEIDCELTSYNELPITFADESAALSKDNRYVVNERLLSLLKERPNLRIQINAHTDSRGSAGANQVLSERRAKAIADYLVTQTVNRARIVSRGYGESQLKNRCADGVNCSEYEHSVNSRVEFRVLNVDI
ncbi:OmpA family protein [Neolewinella persica]|uniref:OmpA family protein n=1 Tax=Neolewinella persica TaxID=70998 RepID=UPI00037AFCF9|nr:OmpA family protein [Neolewinella persica]